MLRGGDRKQGREGTGTARFVLFLVQIKHVCTRTGKQEDREGRMKSERRGRATLSITWRERLISGSRCWWTQWVGHVVEALYRGAVNYGVKDWAVREAGLQTGKLGQRTELLNNRWIQDKGKSSGRKIEQTTLCSAWSVLIALFSHTPKIRNFWFTTLCPLTFSLWFVHNAADSHLK